ncbi:hypothetical protein ACODT3_00370 [Streptomyces sp. 4.24]|uniref:hypothetical protein n=1 Tax=Streptomyces tritrimontium TaxID=3406573 RepID=UPI003BB71FED
MRVMGAGEVCALSFTARPTMRLVADHLLAALTGIADPGCDDFCGSRLWRISGGT